MMSSFNREYFGGVAICRPSHETERTVRREGEAALRALVNAGTYTKRNDINGIIQKHFAFYEGMLKRIAPQVASRTMMEFVLAQYDFSGEVNDKSDRGQLALDELSRWRELGPNFRRSAKYLAECIAMLAPSESPHAEEGQLVELIDRCWICAEQLVFLSSLSTQTYALFPDDTTLELRPDGEEEWFILRLNDPEPYEGFTRRGSTDTAVRKNYIDEMALVYNKDRLKQALDGPFQTSCGFTMTDVFGFGFNLNRNTIQPGQGFDIPFLQESQVLASVQTTLSVGAVEAKRLVDGLTLRQANMLKEGRVVYKPKQEHRAYTRPFFEFPHSSGTHFIWSRRMADECLLMLYTRLVQKHLPQEWEIGEVPDALEVYASSITKEFEGVVLACLGQLGINAGRFKAGIGAGDFRLEIPEAVGELDVLGYWPKENLLVVGECKLVKPTHEPATFRDDIDKFIDKPGNYVGQLQRKAKWVAENAYRVAAALQTCRGFPAKVTPSGVAPVLVTYYPAFASLFIKEVPCVALTEFMADVRKAGVWPYQPVHLV